MFKDKKDILDAQADEMFKDLQDHYESLLDEYEIDCVEIDDLDQNYMQPYVKEPFNSIFNSVDDMVLELGYQDFIEWAFAYYDLESKHSWVNDWSKDILKSVYERLKEREYENNG
jgi:hypothetical protein